MTYSDAAFGIDPDVMAQRVDDKVREELEGAVWRAIATKAAHDSAQMEALLRDVCRDIRATRRQRTTVVVSPEFPHDYDFGFPAAVIRSPIVRPGEAYVLPAVDELADLLLDHEVSLD